MQISTRWLVVLFCGAVLGVAVVAAARALPYQAAPRDGDLLSGRLTQKFESHYDRVFPVRTLGTNLWAALQFSLFGEGRPGVVVGERGWLYTEEEFAIGSDAAAAAHFAQIEDARNILAQSGTALIVALVPAKARVYPEYLGDRQPSSVHRELYGSAREALRARRVRAPDLLHALQRCKPQALAFLRTDTHWTPAGARCAAQALVADTPLARGLRRYSTDVAAAVDHRGDLMQFLPLAPYFDHLLPPADRLRVPSTVEEDPDTDLFGAVEVPALTLIGTSYSADERWNFAGALREASAQDLLNLSAQGQGPFAPMQAYLDELPVVMPRVVIWEIPERYLPMAAPAPETMDIASRP